MQDDSQTLRAQQFGSASGETRRMEDGTPPMPSQTATDVWQFGAGAAEGGQRTMVLGQAQPPVAWLVPITGIRAGRPFGIAVEGTTIGRDAQNEIVLDDPAISRQHAKVKREPAPDKTEQFYIYDLATANGTFVNEQKIVRSPLKDGDKVRLGETTLVFKSIETKPQTKPSEEPVDVEAPVSATPAPVEQGSCSNCGTPLPAGAKFCYQCGTPVPQAKPCANCGNRVEPYMKFCPNCGTEQK